MRVRLTIEYDGTNYGGWQRQHNAVTVQEKLEEAIFASTGERVTCTASGRTDAGVHAMGQVVSFETNTAIPAEKLSFVLNTHLPEDIRVMDSAAAPGDFSARFGAKGKTYRYSIFCGRHSSPLRARTHYCIHVQPDIEKMRETARFIVGTHDFRAFCASGSAAKTTVRTVYAVEIFSEGPCIYIEVTGNGFLYNMVRIIAGTLIAVGIGKLTPEEVRRAIEARDRTLAGVTAPPQGLCLLRVYYDERELAERGYTE